MSVSSSEFGGRRYRLAALQQRVEELEGEAEEFYEAMRVTARFYDHYKAKAEAAEARERVLREALADLAKSECEGYGSPLATGAMERAQAALSGPTRRAGNERNYALPEACLQRPAR